MPNRADVLPRRRRLPAGRERPPPTRRKRPLRASRRLLPPTRGRARNSARNTEVIANFGPSLRFARPTEFTGVASEVDDASRIYWFSRLASAFGPGFSAG